MEEEQIFFGLVTSDNTFVSGKINRRGKLCKESTAVPNTLRKLFECSPCFQKSPHTEPEVNLNFGDPLPARAGHTC